MKRSVIGFVVQILALSTATGTAALAETITGWVDHAEEYALSVGVDGVVEEISVKEGERVLPGTLLLSLNDDVLKADIAATKSALSLGEEEMHEASRSYERDQSLFDEGSLATVELDLAKIKLLGHKARAASLKAELAAAQQRLAMSKIVAPFAGFIAQLNVTKGQAVNMASMPEPMLVFTSSALKVKAQLPAGTANTPAVSSTVKLGANGNTVSGVVSAIRIADDVQQLSIAIEPSQTVFQPGQPIEIEF